MKHRLKGLLALTLSLVMVFALATNAWGAVWVGSDFLSQSGESVDGASGTATLNISTENGVDVYTLTLNNFTLEDSTNYNAILSDQDLTLNLIGDNKVTASYTGSGGAVAVAVEGSLTINGTGILTADGTYSGISAYNGVDISGGTVTSEGDVHGIISGQGNVSISGGTVNATGESGNGIEATNLTITGGEVAATGNAYGIDTYTLTVSGDNTKVTATGGETGIYTDLKGNSDPSTIKISGGTVNAAGNGYGIYTHSLTISGDNTKVTASGANGYGIAARESNDNSGNITISNGKVTATGGIYGIATDVVTIEGGEVSANAADNGGVGIAGGSITISGENTEVDVGCETGLSADTVSIAGGSTVTIEATTGGTAIDSSNLIMSGDYQWSTNGTTFTSSTTAALTKDIAADTAKLYIQPATTGGGGGGYTPPIYYPTVTVDSPKTFDGGIGLYVAMSLLSVTGGALLAKKKD